MLLQDIIILLILLPFFLFITTTIPQTQIIFFFLWFLSVSLDLLSTYEFYKKEPNQFSINERNKLFIYLTKKFGFKKAATTFPIIIELPLLTFLTLIPIQTLHTYLYPTTPPNLHACLTTSLAIAATAHLQATTKNKQKTTHK